MLIKTTAVWLLDPGEALLATLTSYPLLGSPAYSSVITHMSNYSQAYLVIALDQLLLVHVMIASLHGKAGHQEALNPERGFLKLCLHIRVTGAYSPQGVLRLHYNRAQEDNFIIQ